MAIPVSRSKRFKRWRLTDEEYSRVLLPKIINGWSDRRLDALYKIVVVGERQSDIAKELGVSRAAICNMVRTAYTIYSEAVISTLLLGR